MSEEWTGKRIGDVEAALTKGRRGGVSPSELYEQTGGGDAYRVAMLDHGYVIPTSPSVRSRSKPPGKRLEPCGLLHKTEWSEWRDYHDSYGPYQGRWCRVCARTDSRAVPS